MFSRTVIVVASVLLLQPITAQAQLLRHRKQKNDKPLVVNVLNVPAQPLMTPIFHVEPELAVQPTVHFYRSAAPQASVFVEASIVREPVAAIAPVTNTIPVRTSPIAASRQISGDIHLTNPKETEGTLYFTLNDVVYAINPGESKTIRNDRDWIIKFDNGNSKEIVYRLTEGSYEFSVSHTTGWDLARRTVDAGSTRGRSNSIATPPDAIPSPTSALSMAQTLGLIK